MIGAGTGKDVGVRVATSGTAVGFPDGILVAPVGSYVTGFPKASTGYIHVGVGAIVGASAGEDVGPDGSGVGSAVGVASNGGVPAG